MGGILDLVSGIFNGFGTVVEGPPAAETTPTAPPAPPPPPATMPTMNDDAVQKARRRAILAQSQRSGRESTIMSQQNDTGLAGDRLGG